jgi:recombinase
MPRAGTRLLVGALTEADLELGRTRFDVTQPTATDGRPEMDTVPTVSDIIATGIALNPKEAAGYHRRQYGDIVATPVYDRVQVNGKVIDLQRKRNGTVVCGYVRVSNPKRRSRAVGGEGWSIDYQVSRIIDYCVHHKLAFRIVSDQGLSGSLPHDDPDLLKLLRDNRARVYEELFRNIFLSETERTKLPPEEVHSCETWLNNAVSRIRLGKPVAGMAHAVSEGDEEEPRASPASKHIYRPGLTFIMDSVWQWHTVIVMDLSRLCRSHDLFSYIGREFLNAKVSLVGLIESLDWFNRRDLNGDLQGRMLVTLAEHQLREALGNSLRGIAQMLMAGKPHGSLPWYLERITETHLEAQANPSLVGRARFKEGMEADYRRHLQTIVDLYLEGEGGGEHGFTLIAGRLHDLRIPAPGGKEWHWTTVRYLLRNPALIGCQECFGRRWNTLPVIIQREDFERIQARMRLRSATLRITSKPCKDGYLMTGLIVCAPPCGCHLVRRPNSAGWSQYTCTKNLRKKQDRRRHPTFMQADVDRFFNDLMREYQADIIAQMDPPSEVQWARMRLEWEACLTEKSEEQQALVRALQRVDADSSLSWDTLTNSERNCILRELFVGFYIEGEPPNEVIVPMLRTRDRRLLPPIRLSTTGNRRAFTRRMPQVDEWVRSIPTIQASGVSVRD